MEYIDNLVGQFIRSTGIKRYDMNSRDFLREFSNWVIERQQMGKDYLSLLKDMNINFNSFSTAEVGKTSFDSICKNYLTTIITPYPYGFETHTNIMETPFKADPVGSISIRFNKQELMFVRRYLTYNPYSEQDIHNWDKIHNYGTGIVVGIYGRETDKDMVKKIEMLQRFKLLLDNEIVEEETNINGTYCKVMASKKAINTRGY